MAETKKRQGSEAEAHMAQAPADKAPAKSRRGVKPLVAALVVLLAIGVGGTVFLVNQYLAGQRQAQIEEQTPVPENPAEPEGPEEDPRPANPIDFPSLKAEHPDIYAWVTIPDTGVNHPIVQSTTDDNYYLYHDLDGNYTIYGSVFTQSMNALRPAQLHGQGLLRRARGDVHLHAGAHPHVPHHLCVRVRQPPHHEQL